MGTAPRTTHRPGDFIAYPTNRVVGTIADPAHARAAIEALLRAGVDREDIDILHGEGGLHRLDPSGAEHGFLARFQRTLIRLAGPRRSPPIFNITWRTCAKGASSSWFLRSTPIDAISWQKSSTTTVRSSSASTACLHGHPWTTGMDAPAIEPEQTDRRLHKGRSVPA